jgi:hypothetical protein
MYFVQANKSTISFGAGIWIYMYFKRFFLFRTFITFRNVRMNMTTSPYEYIGLVRFYMNILIKCVVFIHDCTFNS